MPTHLIIDGYNLLGGSEIRSGHLESSREMLLHDLAAYRHRKRHLITVVFDGWQQGRSTEQREHRAGLQVIYSRRGERADQVIQRLAREYGSDCAVVSSDHEIINAAKACGAFVMGSQEFAGSSVDHPLHHPVRCRIRNWIQGMTFALAVVRGKRETPESCRSLSGNATVSSNDFEEPLCVVAGLSADLLERQSRTMNGR